MPVFFGLSLASQARLRVDASAANGAPLLRACRRGNNPADPPVWIERGLLAAADLPLTPGDYVFVVDNVVPSAATPVTLTVEPRGVLVNRARSAAARGSSPGGLSAFEVSGALRLIDPKNPPPPPGARAAAPTLDGEAWFATTLETLDNLLPRGAGSEPPPIHALLIGIDDYVPVPGQTSPIYPPLAGCVQDVLDVESYLLHDLGVPAERITRLLAPAPGRAVAPRDGDARPTYENIVAAWTRLADETPRDHVAYVHYSGHGGTARTRFPEIKGDKAIDEAIAPCDINAPKVGRYLRDVEIAALIQRMGKRGAFPTLIMDSCHSGGLTRGEQAARRGGVRPDTEERPREAESLVASRDELAAQAKRLHADPAARSASSAAWAFGAGDYVLLAACREHESAYEFAFDGGRRRGALTYRWLEALRQVRGRPTYGRTVNVVRDRVHTQFRDQSPVLFGSGDRQVLGVDKLESRPALTVTRVSGDVVELSGGASGGLAYGDRFAVIPPERIPELLGDLASYPEVVVNELRPTTATAEVAPGARATIEVGSQAVLRSSTTRLRRRVWVDASASAAKATLDRLRDRLNDDKTGLIEAGAGAGGDFVVETAAHGDGLAFELLGTGGQPLPHLGPTLPAIDDSIEPLVKRLIHLAKYRNVLELGNGSDRNTLADQLRVELLRRDQRGVLVPLAAPARLRVGQGFVLAVHNDSAKSLSVAILNCQPDWGVSVIDGTLQLRPGASTQLELALTLPDHIERGTDVLKAIATVTTADFSWLELPAMGSPLAARSATRGASRGGGGALEQLMRLLDAPPPAATRTVYQPPSPFDGWTTTSVDLEVTRT